MSVFPTQYSYVVFTPRYYFRNWYKCNENETPVSRYPLKSKTEEEALPLYDGRSLDYLFSQVSIQHCVIFTAFKWPFCYLGSRCLFAPCVSIGQI